MENRSKPPYLLGLLCFLPLIGAFVGVALILYGVLKYKDKWLVIIGSFGLIFTVSIYSFLFYELKYGRMAGEGFAVIAQKELNSLANEIEFYKFRHGKYPDNLEQLQKNNINIFITDPLVSRKLTTRKPYFQYINKGDQYLLFSVGIDGVPNTKDDLYPQITDSAKYGFIKP